VFVAAGCLPRLASVPDDPMLVSSRGYLPLLKCSVFIICLLFIGSVCSAANVPVDRGSKVVLR